MTCSDFMEGFSDYHDEILSSLERGRFEEHLGACTSCRRYRDVVVRGTSILRGETPVGPGSEFRDRLRHSILTLEEERRRRRYTSAPTGFTAVAAVAVLVSFVAAGSWAFSSDPVVDLQPVVASPPPAPEVHPLFAEGPTVTTSTVRRVDASLWTDSHSLLVERSTLLDRQRGAGVFWTGGR